jgi:mono/diheme cytochrome c family protein
MNQKLTMAAVLAIAGAATAIAATNPAQKAIQDQYAALARAADPAFKEGDVKRGEAFFQGRHTGGKSETPSCTTCHTSDLKKPGQTRASKEIAPMAASVNPKRYTDPAEVAKWFKRNCSDVLGRECTAAEKSDVLAYLLSL